jgi:hypothetical protein
MGDFDSSATSGVEVRGYRRGTASTDGWDQYVVPVRDRISSGIFRANSFRIPGAAGTTGQKLLTLHNATGSTIFVEVQKIYTDVMFTAAKVVAPPIIRVHKITVLPTGGAACPKVALLPSTSSSSSVTVLQGASAEGTGSAITATIPASSIITQIHAPRALTLVGYEPYDRSESCEDDPIVLGALEGVCLNLDYSVATANPTSDIWLAGIVWEEFTRP